MTFSLVAVDPRTGQVGVAAMTAMPGVGKLVAHARPGVGAAASQAMVNPYLAFDGLDLLEEGRAADEAASIVVGRDPEELVPEIEMLPTRDDPLGGFDDEGNEGSV